LEENMRALNAIPWRIITVVVLVGLAAWAFAGCGGEPSEESEQSEQSEAATASAGTRSETVTFAHVPGWATGAAMDAVWRKLLEEKGYSVEFVEVDLGPAFAGVARGDIDIFTNTWLPSTHASYLSEFEDQIHLVTPPWNTGGKLGLVVPEYVSIDSISDLPANASDFDGKIVGIEAGAGIMKVLEEEVIPAYGLDESFELVQSSTPAMLATVEDAINSEEPIVASFWTPHWAWAKLPVKFLADPKEAWPPPDSIHMITSLDFAEENPQVVEWLGRAQLTSDQVASLLLAIQNADGDAEQGASVWLAENREAVDKWVS